MKIDAVDTKQNWEAQLETLATLFLAEIELLENGTIYVLDGDVESFISPSGGLIQHRKEEK